MFLLILVSSLVIGSVYGLIALGYSLIYRSSGLMSFIQGDLLTLGAFLGYTLYGPLQIPFAISLAIVSVFMFFFGMLIERGVIRRLQNKNVLAIYTVLATIAISYIIQNGAMFTWGTSMKAFPPVFETREIQLFGRGLQSEAVFCVVVGLVTMAVLHVFMNLTSLGTSMRAAAMDPVAARACGIDVSWTIGLSWGIAAGIAALGGMLIGPIYGVYTTFGAAIGRKGFSSAVIGGYGNMIGAILGGLLLGIVETFTAAYISSAYKELVAYTLLIIFLFVKPTGLLNERAIAE